VATILISMLDATVSLTFLSFGQILEAREYEHRHHDYQSCLSSVILYYIKLLYFLSLPRDQWRALVYIVMSSMKDVELY
jgi:hypothetical protein